MCRQKSKSGRKIIIEVIRIDGCFRLNLEGMLIDDFQTGNGCLPFIQLACIIKSFDKFQPQHALHQRICDKIKGEFNVFGGKRLSIAPFGIWI
ncbi:hypothetical protein D3C80_1229890 [compost metagenome]